MRIDRETVYYPPLGPVAEREVPQRSGEAAIYSPEYLERREGNANGTRPETWRLAVPI